MKTLKWPLILLLICSAVCAQSVPNKYGLNAKPLRQCFQYFQTPDSSEPFWKIIPYYKGQETDSSCSLASVTMVMNTLIPSPTRAVAEKLLTESSVLQISGSLRWRVNTRNSSIGLTLFELVQEWRTLLVKMKLEHKYEVHFREMNSTQSRQDFLKVLDLFLQDKAWIIMNFDQGIVMGEGNYGHFSPIGSFNKNSREILIMDTDRHWYEPYWIKLEMAYKSMDSKDDVLGVHHGFLWIQEK